MRYFYRKDQDGTDRVRWKGWHPGEQEKRAALLDQSWQVTSSEGKGSVK